MRWTVYDTDLSISKGWTEVPLATLSRRRRGYSWAKEQEAPSAEPGAVPVVRIPNIGDHLDLSDLLYLRGVSEHDVAEFAVEKDWILYVGSNGNPDRIGDSVFLCADEPMLFASFLQAITTREHDLLLPEFLARWMRLHRVHEMFSKTSQQTTGLANFSWSAVKRLPVRFPVNLDEQRTILRVLRIADEAVSAAKAEFQISQRLKTALLQELFTKGLPGQHQRFKQTKIGQIPEEWDAPKLGSFADIEAGVALNPERAPRSNPYQYLTVVNVQRGSVTIDEPRFLELWESEVPKKLLRNGDIVVVEGHANSGEIGRAAMVGPEHEGFTYQNHLFRIRQTKEGIRRDFLLYALNAEYARRHWNAVCNTSSGLNTINRRQLRRLLVPQPRPEEQDRIVELIAMSEAAISTASDKIRTLERLKCSLLQNLLTGRIRLQAPSAQATNAGHLKVDNLAVKSPTAPDFAAAKALLAQSTGECL